MKRSIRFIYTLLVCSITIMQPFLAISYARAQGATTPAPASICKVKNSLTGAKITCTPVGGKAIEFSKGVAGTRQEIVSIKSIEMWIANEGTLNYGFPIFLVIARPNGSSGNDMTNMNALAIAKQVDKKDYSSSDPASMALRTTAGSINYYRMMIKGVTFNNFYGAAIPPDKAAKINNLKALGDTIVSKDGIAVQFSGSGSPSASTQGLCNDSGAKVLLNASDTERATLLDKLAAAYTQNLDAFAKTNPSDLPNVAEVKTQISNLFTEQKTKKNIVTDDEDKTIYKTYYRTELDGKTFPNVIVNQETLRQFSSKITELSGDDASAQLPIKGIFGLRNKFLEMSRRGDIRNALKTEIEIAYMYYYLEKNLKYRECADKNGDKDYAQYDASLMTQLNNLYSGTTETLQIHDEQDECSGITGNLISALVKKGFCGMLVMMKEFADWLFGHAKNWLSASLGVAENKDLTTPADQDPAAGGGGGGSGDAGSTFTANLQNGGVVRVANSTTLSALKATPSGQALITKYKSDGSADGKVTGNIALSASGSDSIKVQLTAPQDLMADTAHPKYQVQFVAQSKGYKFWITKTGTEFTLSGDAGAQITAMGEGNLPDFGTSPTTGDNTSIKSQAVALCNTKKSSGSITAANWEKGPCLISNMNNTGYAVDIAHNPRISSDDANTCTPAPTKYVELDTSCKVIRANPTSTQ